MQIRQIANVCILLFKEDKQLPLEVEIEINQNKTSSLPFSLTHSSLVDYISEEQKTILEQEIQKVEKFYQMAEGNNITQVTQQFNISKEQMILQFAPDFAFGSNPLKNIQSDYEFQELVSRESTINQQPQSIDNQQSQKSTKHNITILIYDGCPQKELMTNINQYLESQIVIFINGKQSLKQYLSSLSQIELNKQIQEKFNKFYTKYQTSSNHALYFEIDLQYDKKMHLIITPFKMEQPQLIKWIFNGILKHIDPKYALITSTNLKFEIYTISKLIGQLENLQKEKEKKKQNILALQWNEDFEIGRDVISSFNFYSNNLGQQNCIIDSIFPINKFHNPLSCLYDWEKMSEHIFQYVNMVQHQESLTIYSMNDLLPTLIYNQNKQQIGYLSNVTSKTNLSKLCEPELFQFYCLRQYNIQNELKKKLKLSNKEIQIKVFIGKFFQYLLSKLLYFQQYFGLSICLFFSFQCPYQVIDNILDSSVGYTAIAIIVPALYGINVILILIMSTLYSVQDRFICKNTKTTLPIKIKHDKDQNKYEYEKYDPYKIYDQYEITLEQKDQKNLIIVKKDDKELEFDLSASNNQDNELYIQVNAVDKLQSMNEIFNLLLQNQKILDFTIVIAIIANLIISYGPNFLELEEVYQFVVLIFALILLFFMVIQKRLNILAMIFNFSLLSFISQIYLTQQKIGTPEQQIQRKKDLALQLLINCLLFYVFICIESYYLYSGYILLGILGALLFIEFTKSILLFIGICCQREKKVDLVDQQNQSGRQYQLKLNQNFNGFAMITQNFTRLLRNENANQQQEVQQQINKNHETKQKVREFLITQIFPQDKFLLSRANPQSNQYNTKQNQQQEQQHIKKQDSFLQSKGSPQFQQVNSSQQQQQQQQNSKIQNSKQPSFLESSKIKSECKAQQQNPIQQIRQDDSYVK